MAALAWEVLGDGPFRLAGDPVAVAQGADVVAVAGSVGPMQWGSTRDASAGNLEGRGDRVAIFALPWLEPLQLVRLRHRVNDVAIDPTGRHAIIATGSYDGGWRFRGELLALDLATGTVTPLLDADREFSQLSWTPDGALTFVASPSDDADESGYLRHTLDIAAVDPTAPGPLPTEGEPASEETADQLAERKAAAAAELTALSGGAWEPRTRVWDVAVETDGTVTACLPGIVAERWAPDGTLAWRVERPSDGGQLAVLGDKVVWWSQPRGASVPRKGWVLPQPILGVVTADAGTPLPAPNGAQFRPGLLITATDGRLLVRANQARSEVKRSADAWLFPSLDAPPVRVWLSRYDVFNNHLVVRNAPDLLLAVGLGKLGTEDKFIGRVDDTGEVSARGTALFKLEWDRERGAHLFADFGVVIDGAGDDEVGRRLVHTARVFTPQGDTAGTSLLVSRDYATGAPLWEASFDAQCAGVVQLGGLVVAAFVSGELVALESDTGRIAWRQPLAVDGEMVTPLSLASAGRWLAVGLADGRVLRGQWWPAAASAPPAQPAQPA